MNTILNYLDKRYNELIKFTQSLVRINSVQGNEVAVARIIKEKLSEHGTKSKFIGKESHRKTILAEIGRGKRSIILNGHLDTVPIGNIKKWKYHPLSAEFVNGKIYGRGAYDMKAGVAALTFATISLLDSEINGKIILIFNYDEEGGNHSGIKEILNFIKADACIVGESSPRNYIDIGGRGIYRFKTVSSGESAHTGDLHSSGINAIINMNKFLTKLKKIKYHTKNKKFPPFKITPTIIEGGTAINIVPDICKLSVDCRLMYRQTKNSISKKIREIIKELEKKDKEISIRVDDISYIPPAAISEKDRIVKTTVRNAEYILKEKQRLRIGGGASDANLLIQAGIPTVQLGPIGNNAHSENEFVYAKSILDFSKIYALTAMDFLRIQ